MDERTVHSRGNGNLAVKVESPQNGNLSRDNRDACKVETLILVAASIQIDQLVGELHDFHLRIAVRKHRGAGNENTNAVEVLVNNLISTSNRISPTSKLTPAFDSILYKGSERPQTGNERKDLGGARTGTADAEVVSDFKVA